MYSSSQLARAISRPAKVHMGAAKHLLRYLAGTTDFTIVYKKRGVVRGFGELQVTSSEYDGNVHDGG